MNKIHNTIQLKNQQKYIDQTNHINPSEEFDLYPHVIQLFPMRH